MVLERAWVAPAAGMFALLGFASPAADVPSTSWALCAASSTVVAGTLHAPVEELRAARGSGRYLTATIDVSEVLKGERSEGAAVTFFSEDRGYAPKSEQLVALDGKAVLLFLTAVAADSSSATTNSYFAGYTADALRARSEPQLTEIRAEIARQARVLRNWQPHPDWPHEAAVKALIEKMLVRTTEAGAFRELEHLGPSAVPAIVDLMDDRRSLGGAMLVLTNGPGAFEAHRIYGPHLVVDALAAMLNQLTGATFGQISNGGTERQRRLAVDGWRIYVDMQRNHTKPQAVP